MIESADVFGKEFYSLKSVCKEYKINDKILFKEKKENNANGVTDTTAIVDKCLITENADYKKGLIEKASPERKKALLKLIKDDDITKSLNQNLVEQKNDNLRKRVEAVGKLFNKKVEDAELKEIEKASKTNKVNDKTDAKPSEVAKVSKPIINPSEVVKEKDATTLEIEKAIKDIKQISDNTLKAIDAVNKSTVEMIKQISDQTIEAIKELIKTPSHSSQEKKTCIQKPEKQEVKNVTSAKNTVNTAKTEFVQTVKHKGEIYDSINVKPDARNKVLKAVKPELNPKNIFYKYATNLCNADFLLEIYRSVIAKYKNDPKAMTTINENYIQALKYLDEMQVYNDFFRKA